MAWKGLGHADASLRGKNTAAAGVPCGQHAEGTSTMLRLLKPQLNLSACFAPPLSPVRADSVTCACVFLPPVARRYRTASFAIMTIFQVSSFSRDSAPETCMAPRCTTNPRRPRRGFGCYFSGCQLARLSGWPHHNSYMPGAHKVPTPAFHAQMRLENLVCSQAHCRRVERASIDEAYLDLTEEAAKLCQEAEAGGAENVANAPETDLQASKCWEKRLGFAPCLTLKCCVFVTFTAVSFVGCLSENTTHLSFLSLSKMVTSVRVQEGAVEPSTPCAA